MLTDQRDQHHGGDILRVLETAPFPAFHDQTVHARLNRPQGALQRGDNVEHGEAGFLQHAGILHRVARRRGDEFDPLINHELDDIGITHKSLRDIHAERLVR